MRRIGNILRLVCVIGTFLTLLSISNAFKLIDNEDELLPTDLLNSNNGIGFYYPKEEPEFLNDLYQLEQEIRDKRRTEGALRFVRRNDNLFDELMLSKKLLKRDLLKRLLMNTRKQ